MFSQRVQAAAVVLFLVVIAGVVYVLLTRVDREAPAGIQPSDPVPDSAPTAEGPVGRVTLAAGEGDLVVRFATGACDRENGASLELSKDRGRSFQQVSVPQTDDGGGVSASSPQVRAIVFAEATSPVTMTIGAADAACDVHRYTTTDRGASWTQEPDELQEWYVDPGTGDLVSPRGRTDAGCEVGTLAPVSKAGAKVFCTDGTIRGTTDRGATWTDVGTLDDASAAVFTDARTGYAVVAGSKCKSRTHATIDGGATWTPMGCIADGQVVRGLTGTEKRLVAGGSDAPRLSTDGGVTWKSPPAK